MTSLITPDLIRLDADLGADKSAVITSLAALLSEAGRTSDTTTLESDLNARESTSATGMNGGIAIPHCRTAAVDEPTVGFVRLAPSVDFGAKDGPADLVFVIAAPEGGDQTHLTILTKLARQLVRKEFTEGLRNAATPEDAHALIIEGVGEPAATEPAKATAAAPPEDTTETTAPPEDTTPAIGRTAKPSLVAVTSCPTGIAHTYMAAEALENAAAEAGVELAVETQGSAGSTPLDAQIIRDAGAVIFAADVGVRDRGRFAGKPVLNSGVKRPIEDAAAMIDEAVKLAGDPKAATVKDDGAQSEDSSGSDESWGGRTRRVLMTGVSYMIPFVAAGGLMIALGFLLGGYDSVDHAGDILINDSLTNPPSPAEYGLERVPFDSGILLYFGILLFVLGQAAFALFVPALAGYIAYAIADRPGIAPGFIMGAIATNLAGFTTSDGMEAPESGFIGAILGGVLAGVIALWVSRWKVPDWARGLMPVLVIPLVTSIIAGLLMLIVLGFPISWLMDQLESGLNALEGAQSIILGAILGLMMSFDMGGPLNKVAYSFAVAGLGTAGAAADAPELQIMAAVMLAGMVPPIALSLATVVRPKLFSAGERESGKAGWLLGASFITEGAIPFAAADPLRVIPSIMLGSAVTGAVAQALGVGVRAPHGGIFVLFAVNGVLGYIIALIAGVLVGAASVIALKSLRSEQPSSAPARA